MSVEIYQFTSSHLQSKIVKNIFNIFKVFILHLEKKNIFLIKFHTY